MADPCAALPDCANLDGRLLVQRTVYGPQLALDTQPFQAGGFTAAGAAIRPYLDLRLGVTWRSTGLCRAPATSIMGLAPGEVVTVGLRVRQSRTFSSLVRDAAEASRNESHTLRDARNRSVGPPPAAGSGGGAAGGDVAGQLLGTAVQLAPLLIGALGSLLGDALSVAGGVGGAILGGPLGGLAGAAAGKAVGDLIDGAVSGGAGGGPGPALVETVQMTHEVLDTVSRSESESHLRETTVTTSQESEQTVRRTFGNPYLDRSLQLRFFPVFNQFEVTTVIVGIRPGLAALLAEPAAAPRPAVQPALHAALLRGISRPVSDDARAAWDATALGARPVAATLLAASAVGDDDGVHRPMVDLLRRAGAEADVRRGVLLERGLAWHASDVRGNGIHVPLSAASDVASAWRLQGAVSERLSEALRRLEPDALNRLFPRPLVRTVHVYAGTDVEAVPGTCILPDIPDELKVVVPGATEVVNESLT